MKNQKIKYVKPTKTKSRYIIICPFCNKKLIRKYLVEQYYCNKEDKAFKLKRTNEKRK